MTGITIPPFLMSMEFEHYLVRRITQADVESYFAMVDSNRKRLEDFFAGTVSKTKTPDATRMFISEILEKAAAKTYFPFVVINKNDQRIIGFIDVKNIDWNIPKAELGCFIDEKFAGKGVSKKALSLVIDHLIHEMGFIKLFLRTHQTNVAAQALAEKCGFEVEGIIRRDYKTTKGELVDLIYYGLITS